jgi:diphosphomevalonate decarboxylase
MNQSGRPSTAVEGHGQGRLDGPVPRALPRTATAVAHANIALAKYWGKREIPGNVPATPSVSLTLGGLSTRTTVALQQEAEVDALVLNGEPQAGKPLVRVVRLLDEIRALAGVTTRAAVTSANDFPTASGLASSASGFAALALAAASAYGLQLDQTALSRVARRASASAARSVFGGFVALGTEDDAAAATIAPAGAWDVAIVVAATTLDQKPIGSTEAMERTRVTSPYYAGWVADAPGLAREIHDAILARDLERLGAAAEASALRMHACALGARPPILYWSPATISLLRTVEALRREGVAAYATIDAGPHVKVLCKGADAEMIAQRLGPFAVRTIVARPGPAARLLAEAQ